MANLTDQNSFDDIYQLEQTDPIDAGENGEGIANRQAQQLANRTRFLKQAHDSLAANLKPVAFSGDYDDLEGKPNLGSAATADASEFATAEQGELAEAAIPTSEKGEPDGVATLDENGKVPAQQLPNKVQVHSAEDEAAMLGLTVSYGDLCKRDDDSTAWIFIGQENGLLIDWFKLSQNLPETNNIDTESLSDDDQRVPSSKLMASLLANINIPETISNLDEDTELTSLSTGFYSLPANHPDNPNSLDGLLIVVDSTVEPEDEESPIIKDVGLYYLSQGSIQTAHQQFDDQTPPSLGSIVWAELAGGSSDFDLSEIIDTEELSDSDEKVPSSKLLASALENLPSDGDLLTKLLELHIKGKTRYWQAVASSAMNFETSGVIAKVGGSLMIPATNASGSTGYCVVKSLDVPTSAFNLRSISGSSGACLAVGSMHNGTTAIAYCKTAAGFSRHTSTGLYSTWSSGGSNSSGSATKIKFLSGLGDGNTSEIAMVYSGGQTKAYKVSGNIITQVGSAFAGEVFELFFHRGSGELWAIIGTGVYACSDLINLSGWTKRSDYSGLISVTWNEEDQALYYCNSGVVYRSTDCGSTFVQFGTAVTGYSVPSYFPVGRIPEFDVTFVRSTTGQIVIRIGDDGTWTSSTIQPDNVYGMSVVYYSSELLGFVAIIADTTYIKLTVSA